MASAYRRELLIQATRITAAGNLAILRTQAANSRRPITPRQAMAALIMAEHLEGVVREHAKRRTTH
jgi:hypothetical protein